MNDFGHPISVLEFALCRAFVRGPALLFINGRDGTQGEYTGTSGTGVEFGDQIPST